MGKLSGGILAAAAAILIAGAGVTRAEETPDGFSIIFGGKTMGDHETLSRQAGAFQRVKDSRSLVLGFGSLLGPTPVVRHDIADQFLRSARDAGFDYIIPAAPEFMFGVAALKRFAKNDAYPKIISANVVDRKTLKPVFAPYAIWNVSGKRICVIAFSDTGIVHEVKPGDMTGITVIPNGEALRKIADRVIEEGADYIIAAGPMDWREVSRLAREHPYLDAFLTSGRPGEFPGGGTSTISYAGKTIFVCSEAGGEMGIFSLRERGGLESREFSTFALDRTSPPDERILSALTHALDEFKRRELEEQATVNTGIAAATVLKEVFAVDVAFIERQCFSPLAPDSGLTSANLRSVIRPGTKLTVYSLPGAALKAIFHESGTRSDPASRLIIAGMTPDGKIGSLPVDDTAVYTVLTTMYLREGGNGYAGFGAALNERLTGVDAFGPAERFLVRRDERLRRASRTRNWNLVANLSVGSNFNKQDVDDEKALYGSSLPTRFKSLSDQFFGYVRLGSEGNSFTYKKKKHSVSLKLNAVFQRTGTRPDSGTVVYTKSSDFVRLDGRYEYDVMKLGSRPYIDMTVNSILYSGEGRHPLSVNASTGLTRKFPKLWLDTSLGINGTRNYATNANSLGLKTNLSFKRVFPPRALFSGQTTLTSETEVFWSPVAQSLSEFRHENHNRASVQLLRKLDLVMGIHTYSYRNSKYHRSAVGIHYDLNLTYGMQWKI